MAKKKTPVEAIRELYGDEIAEVVKATTDAIYANEIKVYTIDEVADLLHVTRRTLYSYIKGGKLQAVKVGKYWRITQENLEQLLSTGTKDATAAYRVKPGGASESPATPL